MTKFEKNGLTLVVVLTIPFMLFLYSIGAKQFIDYVTNSEIAVAEVISTKKKINKYIDGCVFHYSYDAEGQQYSGNDELALGGCPQNISHVNIFYLKDKPNKSIMGLDVFLLFFPLVLISLMPSWIRRYRHLGNRKGYCILYMSTDSIFLILAVISMGFYTLHPLQVKDAYSNKLGGFMVLACVLALYDLYRNYINYVLYKRGKPTKAVVTNIKEELNVGRDIVVNRKISYEYELGSKKYTGDETLPEKESAKYKMGEAVSLLYHPHKKHVSCLNV